MNIYVFRVQTTTLTVTEVEIKSFSQAAARDMVLSLPYVKAILNSKQIH